jgi:hypothetical protein
VTDLFLLWWLCTTGGDCVSLDSSCVLLQWLYTTGSECVSLDSRCVLLVDYRVVNGLLDEDIMERYLPR